MDVSSSVHHCLWAIDNVQGARTLHTVITELLYVDGSESCTGAAAGRLGESYSTDEHWGHVGSDSRMTPAHTDSPDGQGAAFALAGAPLGGGSQTWSNQAV